MFGLALSVASTVVVIRLLDERRLIDSAAGRISVGWLIVEDLVMVLAIVLLPTLAEIARQPEISAAASSALPSTVDVLASVGVAIGKAVAFVAVMLLFGQRVIPRILHHIAHPGSREIFRLGVFALALGVAYRAAELVGVSFALGAFFCGPGAERVGAQPKGGGGIPAVARRVRRVVFSCRSVCCSTPPSSSANCGR